MKKKILLSIFIIMFAFILNVKAEDSVKIKSVELIDKSEAVKELEEPKHNGLNLDLNLQLFKVGNYAEYKITIENLTNEEVKIKNNGKNVTTTNENITYNYIWDNNDSTIKSKQTKSFTLKVEYTKEIAETNFNEDGNYITSDSLKIEMSQEQQTIPVSKKTTTKSKIKKQEESPQTGDIVVDYIVLIVIAITLIFDIVYYAIIKKDNKKFNKFVLIGSFILLLTSIIIRETYAFTYAEMNVKTNIKISKLPKMMQVCSMYSPYDWDNPEIDKLLNDDIDDDFDINDFMGEGDCFFWSEIVGNLEDEPFNTYMSSGEGMPDEYLAKLIVTTTSEMPEEYEFNNIKYTLEETTDVSEKQNGSVIVGAYKNTSGGLLILLGGDGGVVAPTNSSYLFSGVDLITFKTINLFLLNYIDISNLDVHESLNMYGMFMGDAFISSNEDFITGLFDSSNSRIMGGMFMSFGGYSPTFDFSFDFLDTSKVTNMSWMFVGIGSRSESVKLDLTHLDTSKVTDMSYLFSQTCNYATNIDIDFSSLDTSNVTDMSNMFWEFGNSNIDFNLDLSHFDTSKVTDMYSMFSEYQGKELDLSTFDTSNVTNMSEMFSYSYNLETIYVGDKWDISKVTNSSGMFVQCSKLKGGSGTTFNSSYNNKAYAHIDGGVSNPGYLTLKTN